MVFSWQRFKMCYFSSWGSKNHGKLRNFETTLPKHQRSVHLRTFLSVVNSFLATVTAKSLSAVPPKSIEIQAAQFHIQHWHKRGFSRILPTIALRTENLDCEECLTSLLKILQALELIIFMMLLNVIFWHARWHKHSGIERFIRGNRAHQSIRISAHKTEKHKS